jgi:hypothetical protein
MFWGVSDHFVTARKSMHSWPYWCRLSHSGIWYCHTLDFSIKLCAKCGESVFKNLNAKEKGSLYNYKLIKVL